MLIVDGDDAMRKVLYTIFINAGGFDACVEAGNASEAIAKAKRLSPNLAVVDYAMPDMSGLQLARKLQTIAPDLPIFILTAGHDVAIEKEALSFWNNRRLFQT